MNKRNNGTTKIFRRRPCKVLNLCLSAYLQSELDELAKQFDGHTSMCYHLYYGRQEFVIQYSINARYEIL